MNKAPLPDKINARREFVFLVLTGLFLGSMTMLNILGISRFITFYKFTVAWESGENWDIAFSIAIGILPYPITFLCTDLICELYGRRRANWVVWVGLILNGWVILVLWVGGILPGSDSPAFYSIRALAFGAVTASMIAYLAAQFCDVYLFHFWKRLTKGKHLWLRNNGSTLVSQLVDTTAVILITYQLGALPMEKTVPVYLQLLVYIGTGYSVKMLIALLDTIPFYLLVHWLRKYLDLKDEYDYAGSMH